jgi:replicative DNA helicase
MAEHVALKLGKPVAVFSMEMGGTELVMRMVGSVGRIDQHHMRTGQARQRRVGPLLEPAPWRSSTAPLCIDETAALNPRRPARARPAPGSAPANGGARPDRHRLPAADERQQRRSDENRATEIWARSRASLKALAKELQCPVIALSQLNRSVEHAQRQAPDDVATCASPAPSSRTPTSSCSSTATRLYNKDSPDKGVAEIIIGKQRNGPIGTVRLMFQGEHPLSRTSPTAPPATRGERALGLLKR